MMKEWIPIFERMLKSTMKSFLISHCSVKCNKIYGLVSVVDLGDSADC